MFSKKQLPPILNMKICNYHNCKKEYEGRPRSNYCSKSCRNNASVIKRRKKLKYLALAYKGDKCQKCGYNKCVEALAFHHLDPTKKDFALSCRGITRAWIKVKEELDKCILLCHNCHMEVHYNIN